MDLALDSSSNLHRGAATLPQSAGLIVFDGQEYASPSEMPVDVRIMYDRMLSGVDSDVPAAAPGRAEAARRLLHTDLRDLQAELRAALAPARSSGNGVLYAAGAVTALVYAVWLLV